MKIVLTQQVSTNCLNDIPFDIYVGATGYEKRATNSLRFLDLTTIPNKLVFGFEDRRNLQRQENDRVFERAGVRFIDAQGDDCQVIMETLVQVFEALPQDIIRIFVDYSSMTRTWYASIISTIRSLAIRSTIECYFGYSPSQFESPLATTPNQSVSPILGFGGLDVIDRPSALIVGLGYEKDRAIGLLEYVDPATCFAFITDPPIDRQYLQTLKRNNCSFLKVIGTDHQYRHPLTDLQRMSSLLLSLVWGLKDQYRIILAPLGVKPFSLICLLLAVKYPELDVWRVTSGTKAGTQSREAIGDMLILRADFLAE